MEFEITLSIKNEQGLISGNHYVVLGDFRSFKRLHQIHFDLTVYANKSEYADGAKPVDLPYAINSIDYTDEELANTPIEALIEEKVKAFYKQSFSIDDSKIVDKIADK